MQDRSEWLEGVNGEEKKRKMQGMKEETVEECGVMNRCGESESSVFQEF